jgi:hypothetical protein
MYFLLTSTELPGVVTYHYYHPFISPHSHCDTRFLTFPLDFVYSYTYLLVLT